MPRKPGTDWPNHDSARNTGVAYTTTASAGGPSLFVWNVRSADFAIRPWFSFTFAGVRYTHIAWEREAQYAAAADTKGRR